MPIVDIKGVGQAQFPDDMPIDDIRSILLNKYYQREAQGQSDLLAPAPQTASPYEPTLTERLGGGIAEGLKGAGLISDNYGAQQIGKNVTALGEFLPGIGDAAAGDEFGRAVAEGDNLGMAMAGIGAIPVVGDAAKKGVKYIDEFPMSEPKDLNVIYSGTMGDAATEVIPYGIHKDSKNNKVSNIFGGIFGSFDENVASSHGGNIQKILTDKHVSHSDMIHDVFYNDEISWDSTVGKVRSILDGHKKYTVNKATDDELEEIIDYMMESKSIYDGEPDMGYDRFNDITGSYVSEDDYESFGDVSWDMQGLKGELGRRMGYDSIGMPDEHGESVLVLNALSINGKPINQNLPTDKK